jgi:hypothetical protein
VYDKGHFKNPVGPVILKEDLDGDMNTFWDLKTVENARLTEEVQSMLQNLGKKIVNKD